MRSRRTPEKDAAITENDAALAHSAGAVVESIASFQICSLCRQCSPPNNTHELRIQNIMK